MEYTWYQWFLIFIIYAIIGWCIEVMYAAVDDGKFVNRGFLNGPMCPIYGFGGSIVIACLYGLREQMWLVFVGGFFLASILEYITGYCLEKIFHERWWDYSDKPFNIRGYICLKFSILWGLACMFVIDIIHPTIDWFVCWLPEKVAVLLVILLTIDLIADISVTIATIIQWKKEMRLMNEIVDILREFSDGVGENISRSVLRAMEKREEWQEELETNEKYTEMKVELEKKKMEMEALKKKYKHLLKYPTMRQYRLEKAFPRLTSKKATEILKKWMEDKK